MVPAAKRRTEPRGATVIFGASSAIAEAWAELRAAEGDELILVARALDRVSIFASHLKVRFNTVSHLVVCDFLQPEARAAAVAEVLKRSESGGLGRIFLAYGVIGDDAAATFEAERTAAVLATNFSSQVDLLCRLVPGLDPARPCRIIGLSSVAGERGRAINPAYCAAKAGMTAYLSGLRARLHRTAIEVYTVKPGPVDSPMTAHLKKSRLFATPDRVAADVAHAERRGHLVVYSPWWWRYVMAIIRILPEKVFMTLRF